MDSKVNRLAILGSTGSIGQQTLDIVRAFKDRLQVTGLACDGKELFASYKARTLEGYRQSVHSL